MTRSFQVVRIVIFSVATLVGLFGALVFVIGLQDCFGWEEAPTHRCTVCRIDHPGVCETDEDERSEHDATDVAALKYCHRFAPCAGYPTPCPCHDEINHFDQYFTAHCVAATTRYRRYKRYWRFSFGWK
jgi:hypothetical protein